MFENLLSFVRCISELKQKRLNENEVITESYFNAMFGIHLQEIKFKLCNVD